MGNKIITWNFELNSFLNNNYPSEIVEYIFNYHNSESYKKFIAEADRQNKRYASLNNKNDIHTDEIKNLWFNNLSVDIKNISTSFTVDFPDIFSQSDVKRICMGFERIKIMSNYMAMKEFTSLNNILNPNSFHVMNQINNIIQELINNETFKIKQLTK
jgi:hypothetical protein